MQKLEPYAFIWWDWSGVPWFDRYFSIIFFLEIEWKLQLASERLCRQRQPHSNLAILSPNKTKMCQIDCTFLHSNAVNQQQLKCQTSKHNKLPQSIRYFRIRNSNAIRGKSHSAIHFSEKHQEEHSQRLKFSLNSLRMVGWDVLSDFFNDSYHFWVLLWSPGTIQFSVPSDPDWWYWQDSGKVAFTFVCRSSAYITLYSKECKITLLMLWYVGGTTQAASILMTSKVEVYH